MYIFHQLHQSSFINIEEYPIIKVLYIVIEENDIRKSEDIVMIIENKKVKSIKVS